MNQDYYGGTRRDTTTRRSFTNGSRPTGEYRDNPVGKKENPYNSNRNFSTDNNSIGNDSNSNNSADNNSTGNHSTGNHSTHNKNSNKKERHRSKNSEKNYVRPSVKAKRKKIFISIIIAAALVVIGVSAFATYAYLSRDESSYFKKITADDVIVNAEGNYIVKNQLLLPQD